jgi:hypothetical protein
MDEILFIPLYIGNWLIAGKKSPGVEGYLKIKHPHVRQKSRLQ